MKNSGEWFQEIGYFRAIAVIEVIILHTTAVVYQLDLTTFTLQTSLIKALYAFTSLAVPHFIFISGFVLSNKYKKDFSVSEFYKKRFSAILLPYLIFTAFYVCYFYVGAALYRSVFHLTTAGHNVSPSVIQLINEYGTALIIGVGQLWFIVLLMQLYLLYPLLIRLYNRFGMQKNPMYLLLVLLLAQIVYVSLATPLQEQLPVKDMFLWSIFYFVFGFFACEHYSAIREKLVQIDLKSITLGVVLATAYYAIVFNSSDTGGYLLWQITTPFYCLLLIAFYLRIGILWKSPHNTLTRAMEKISEDSFGIFLTHGFFVTAYTFTLPIVGLTYTNPFFYLTLAPLVLGSSYLSVEAIYRLPFGYAIIGKRRKKTRGQNPHTC